MTTSISCFQGSQQNCGSFCKLAKMMSSCQIPPDASSLTSQTRRRRALILTISGSSGALNLVLTYLTYLTSRRNVAKWWIHSATLNWSLGIKYRTSATKQLRTSIVKNLIANFATQNLRFNPLEPSGSFSCRFNQCYSYESTIIRPTLMG